MGYADEIRMLKIKLNAMIEENAKLKGGHQALKSINEELSEYYKEAKEKTDIYKSYFDEIFSTVINEELWAKCEAKEKEKSKTAKGDSLEEEKRSKKMADLTIELNAKTKFLIKEINYSKIYIRDKMKEKIKAVENEKAKLIKENEKLRKKIEEYKGNIPSMDEDSLSQTKVGRPPKDVASNPMDAVMNKVEEANKNVKEKKDSLKKSFFDNFSSNSSAKKDDDKKPVPPPKPVTKPSFNSNNLNNGQKPSMKPKTEGSKKMLNFVARINNMTSDEKVEIAHKISKINSDFNLTEKHYQFIKVMAEMGYYKVTDITDTDNATFSNAYKMKNSLVEAGLVQELEEINGATGRSFKPIMLSDLGNMAYVLRFKKNPYESTYIQLIREQKSPAHGLKIQQILEILIDAGYSCSQEDIKKTPSGRDTICDILARKQKTDFRIEYEEGNYTKEDYLDKFSRVWEVTPYLIVIVPNEDVKKKISPIVGELVAQKFRGFDAMKKAGYQELVATITQLKNNPAIITNLIRQKK